MKFLLFRSCRIRFVSLKMTASKKLLYIVLFQDGSSGLYFFILGFLYQYVGNIGMWYYLSKYKKMSYS